MKTVMNADKVAEAWANGQEAKTPLKEIYGSGKGRHLTTDGNTLLSYDRMIIGRTLEDGTKQVLNVSGKNAYSVTTAKHVRLAMYAKRFKYDFPLITPVSKNGWFYFPALGEEYNLTISKEFKTRKGAERNLAANAARYSRWYADAKHIRVIEFGNGRGETFYEIVAEFIGE